MQATHQTIAYTAAHTSKSLIWHVLESFSYSLLTLTVGLSPRRAVLFFGVWFLAGAMAGYGVGLREDRIPRSVPLVARAALLVCLFVAFFTEVARQVVPIALFATGLALHLVYAWLDVPANSLIAKLGSSEAERRHLSRWHAGAGVASGLLIAFWFKSGGGTVQIGSTPWSAFTLASIALIGMTGYYFLSCGSLLKTPSVEARCPATAPSLPWGRLGVAFVIAWFDQMNTQLVLHHVLIVGNYAGFSIRVLGEATGIGVTVFLDRWNRRHPMLALATPTILLAVGFAVTDTHAQTFSVGFFLAGIGHGMNGVGLWAAIAAWSPATRRAETAGLATLLFKVALALSVVPFGL